MGEILNTVNLEGNKTGQQNKKNVQPEVHAHHFATTGQPETLIDTIVEWENNPENDDFWA